MNDRDVPAPTPGSPVPENAPPPLDPAAMGMPPPRPATPAVTPPPIPAAAAGGEPRRESPSRRRNEVPVLVIETGDASPARGLEATVEELQKRLRETESQLRQKDEALIRMKGRGTPAPPAGRPPESAPAAPPEVGQFFGPILGSQRPAQDERVQAVPVEPRVRMRPQASLTGGVGQGVSGTGVCPFCTQRLRKAKCLNVRTLVCLSCRGVYLDLKSVHQLAKTQTWFKFVERFLNSPRNAAAARKPRGPSQKSTAR